MSKKKVIIIISAILLIFVLVLAVIFVLQGRKRETTTSPGSRLPLFTNEAEESGEVVSGDLKYSDEAGFSFSYPKGITVRDETPEEDDYYSKLSLNKGSQSIILVAMDASEASLEVYIQKQKAGATLIGATTLGSIAAKQYRLGNNLLTLALDQGVLYSLEGPYDGGYWEDVQSLVVGSFSFSGKTTSGSSGSVIYEEEEVIQ